MGGRGASSTANKVMEKYNNEILGNYIGKKGKPLSIDEALKVNPNYDLDTSYQENCQRVVYAYELARRGYDVKATANIKKDDPFNWQQGFAGQYWEKNLGARVNKVENNIQNKMNDWGEGSRGILYVVWKGGNSAHVMNIENHNGKVTVYDAQSGRKRNLNTILNNAMPSKTMISRVDNLPRMQKNLKWAVRRSDK